MVPLPQAAQCVCYPRRWSQWGRLQGESCGSSLLSGLACMVPAGQGTAGVCFGVAIPLRKFYAELSGSVAHITPLPNFLREPSGLCHPPFLIPLPLFNAR